MPLLAFRNGLYRNNHGEGTFMSEKPFHFSNITPAPAIPLPVVGLRVRAAHTGHAGAEKDKSRTTRMPMMTIASSMVSLL